VLPKNSATLGREVVCFGRHPGLFRAVLPTIGHALHPDPPSLSLKFESFEREGHGVADTHGDPLLATLVECS
jgi:hypothetical protein